MPHGSPGLVADAAQLRPHFLRHVASVLREIRARHNESCGIEQQRRLLAVGGEVREKAKVIEAVEVVESVEGADGWRRFTSIASIASISSISSITSQLHPHHRQRRRDRLVLTVQL